MIFYECKVGGKTVLAGTQADAKALDRGFKQVDLPTDKAGYMKLVNELYAQAHATAAVMAEPDIAEALAEPVPPTPIVIATGLPKDYRGHADDCPGCLRSKRAADILGSGDQVTAISEVVGTMTIPAHLARINEAVSERLTELAMPAVQPVAPRARIRKVA